MPKPRLCKNCQKASGQKGRAEPVVTKIARSSLKGAESLWVIFLPVKPYRCLQCYHRFWQRDAFFSHTKRAVFWLLILLAISFIIFSNKNDHLHFQENIIEQPNNTRLNEMSLNYLKDVPTSPSRSRKKENLLKKAHEKERGITLSNKQKLQNLDSQLSAQHVERQSLLKLQIKRMLNAWENSWETGDSRSYLSFYGESFQPPKGLNHEKWRAQRIKHVRPDNKIDIQLSNFTVAFVDYNQVLVLFDQRYSSPRFSDEVRKQLKLVKQDGQWKITSETVQN